MAATTSSSCPTASSARTALDNAESKFKDIPDFGGQPGQIISSKVFQVPRAADVLQQCHLALPRGRQAEPDECISGPAPDAKRTLTPASPDPRDLTLSVSRPGVRRHAVGPRQGR